MLIYLNCNFNLANINGKKTILQLWLKETIRQRFGYILRAMRRYLELCTYQPQYRQYFYMYFYMRIIAQLLTTTISVEVEFSTDLKIKTFFLFYYWHCFQDICKKFSSKPDPSLLLKFNFFVLLTRCLRDIKKFSCKSDPLKLPLGSISRWIFVCNIEY